MLIKRIIFASICALSLVLIVAISLIGVIGCSAILPRSTQLPERLKEFEHAARSAPLKSAVTVRWNAFAVPFIEASNDADLAYTLGMLHAHLRGGQIEVLRRVVQGRLSEMAGPFSVDIDHALRAIDFGRAIPEIERNLPSSTREWLSNFCDGLNYYFANAKRQPAEFGIMGLEHEPWSVSDALLQSRLAGIDVSWLAFFSLLEQRKIDPDFVKTWQRMLKLESVNPISFEPAEPNLLQLSQVLRFSHPRSGSNSIVIAPMRSASGAPLVANDPHLGFNLPNFWLLVGAKSDTSNAVGMMIPGVPIFGLGRSEYFAWGGTNMRAAASDLVQVSEEDIIGTRTLSIKRRAWFTAERSVRESRFGPVISDVPIIPSKPGESFALKWVGHEASDEISAFLAAMRAKTVDEFKGAFSTFGVSAQNILFTSASGEIGQILAAWIPRRASFGTDDFVISKGTAEHNWQTILTSEELPSIVNPASGYIVSANNKPATSDIPIGFSFSSGERILRMQELIESKPLLTLDDLKSIQMDVYSPYAIDLRNQILSQIPAELSFKYSKLIAQLAAWDGNYSVNSQQAVLFEHLLSHIVQSAYPERNLRSRSRTNWSMIHAFLHEDLENSWTPILESALASTEKQRLNNKRWGEIHSLRIGHILSSIPVLGRLFELNRIPIGGSRETLMKTAHGLTSEPHTSSYGSQSRHLSDMSDSDANYFILFGGQDGMLGSQNFVDQVPLWQTAAYIQLPLNSRRFADYVMILGHPPN